MEIYPELHWSPPASKRYKKCNYLFLLKNSSRESDGNVGLGRLFVREARPGAAAFSFSSLSLRTFGVENISFPNGKKHKRDLLPVAIAFCGAWVFHSLIVWLYAADCHGLSTQHIYILILKFIYYRSYLVRLYDKKINEISTWLIVEWLHTLPLYGSDGSSSSPNFFTVKGRKCPKHDQKNASKRHESRCTQEL